MTAIKAWIKEVVILLLVLSKLSSGATSAIKKPQADRTIVHITTMNPINPKIANSKPSPLYEQGLNVDGYER